MHTERTVCEYKHCHLQAKERGPGQILPSQSLEGTSPANNLTSGFWPPELRQILLVEPLSLCYCVKAVPKTMIPVQLWIKPALPWGHLLPLQLSPAEDFFSHSCLLKSPAHLKFTASDSTQLPSMLLASADATVDPCQSLMAWGPGLLSPSLHSLGHHFQDPIHPVPQPLGHSSHEWQSCGSEPVSFYNPTANRWSTWILESIYLGLISVPAT